ncbi:MAG: TIM barrel protein [Candidatus Woesearchaeota archaeon]|nr:TIM barrel protein [Candidatus Woesearchaeota archaeon]
MVIRIGPAGTGGDSLKGIHMIKEAGLDAVEIEFVRGVKMSNELAKKIGEDNRKLGLVISVHAPYYINLASEEKPKIEASKRRILDSCERGHYMGAKFIVFHAAYYGKTTKEECYKMVKDAVEEMQEKIRQKKWGVVLCPETTGKASQFGDLNELIILSKETGCGICIDFAHLEARYSKEYDYADAAKKIRNVKNITAHFSGIEYTAKGERNHILTQMSKAKKLIDALKKEGVSITIINESPDPMGDALKMKKLL